MFRRFGRRAATALVVGALVALGVACGGDASGPTGSARSASITVFATASLSSSFTELSDAFERTVDGVSVTLNFAASSELVTQINQGASADVFASADDANMDRLEVGIGVLDEPRVFATNSLQIIVEAGNPHGITDLRDLARSDLVVVAAAPEVPIGAYTRQVLAAAGVEVTPRSLERSVRGVVGKVVLGEADAGIVYVTDVLAAGADADGVEIPAEVNVVARYPIARPTSSTNETTAQAFIDFVLSDAGQEILASHGFTAP